MALDRFVHWNGAAPTKEQLQAAIYKYAEGINPKEPPLWHHDRWIIPLCGTPGTIDKGTLDRWVEVWSDEHCVDVITRQADDITNAIADGLAKLLARRFDGRIEEP